MKTGKPYGFTDGGSRYVVRDPNCIRKADYILWNDSMAAHVDHRGEFDSFFMTPDGASYSRQERLFYVRDDRTGKTWLAPHDPLQPPLENFECSFGRGDVTWKILNDGIELTLRAAVSREDHVEMWTVSVRNSGRASREVSLFTYFPVWVKSWFSSGAVYDAKLGGMVYDYFPYYVKIEDYYAKRKGTNLVYCLADRKPSAHEINIEKFFGKGNIHRPDALAAARLANTGLNVRAPGGGIFQYKLKLAGQQSWTGNFIFGPAHDRAEIAAMKKRYLKPGGVDRAVGRVYEHLRKFAPTVQIETPDAELNSFVNYWLPAQTLRISRKLRHHSAACARNAMLDAVGGMYTDPSMVRKWYPVIFGQQEKRGFMPHGIPLFKGVTPGGINTIPHRDMMAWAPPELLAYIGETGDMDILDLQVPWKDAPGTSSLYEHICRGMDWQLKDRSKRGFSLIGQGDWTDPLNMAGHKGKGESVWLTEAVSIALQSWAPICERRGDVKLAARYRKAATELNRLINKYAWDGKWYIYGTTDAGKPFGSHRNDEGRIWVNPQGWAMICGAAKGGRLESCIKSVKNHLATPSGNLILTPAYKRMHEDIGKICLKKPGLEENGGVYCHSALFYAHGLYSVRRADDAFDAFRVILPGYKASTVERTGQIPIYIANYYRGTAAGESAGMSSHESTTGSAPWFYRLVVQHLFGIRGEFDGLRLDPQLPSKWKRARAWKKFRGAEFDIEVVRRRGAGKTTVTLDGVLLKDNLVPVQKAGSRHKVLCAVG